MSSRVVLVSGGLGTLGQAVVQRFRAGGDRVAIVDKAQPAAGWVAGAAELVCGGVDLSDAAQTRASVERVVATLGGIDVLVNVAGGFVWQLFADVDLANWDRMYAMNLRTALVLTQAALPAVRRSKAGRIVLVGAGAAAGRAAAGMAAYTASKAGVHKLTESLADELKDAGITVNAVLPGMIDTPVNRKDVPDADFTRWVAPTALADVIHFLASAEAQAVTGALIPVNGRG
jgi:NAD(P)-dependent dehydrogenase (short-subunit alcohol dehydrogenase family)